jgi:hypothetical protein
VLLVVVGAINAWFAIVRDDWVRDAGDQPAAEAGGVK